MGNISTCYSVALQTSTIIGADGNSRRINLPITAAEVMLDDPGFIVAPVLQIRRNRVVPAMKADELLLPGRFYLLVSAGRAHSKVSATEMELIDSVCKRRKLTRRRSSKVLPSAATDGCRSPAAILSEDATGVLGLPMVNRRRWSPSVDSISEKN